MFKKEKISAKNPLHTKGCKGLAILTVMIILFSFISVPSSAEENPYNYTFEGLTIEYVFLSLYDSNGNRVECDFSIYQPSPNNRMEIYTDLVSGDFLKGQKYRMSLYMETSGSLVVSDKYVIGGFDVYCWDYYNKLYNMSANRVGFYIDEENDKSFNDTDSNVTLSNISNSTGSGYDVNFKGGKSGYKYSTYRIFCDIEIMNNRDILGIFIDNVDLKALTPEEYASYNAQENEKNEVNNSGNGAIDDLTSAIPDYSGNIISAFTRLAQKVMHNNPTCTINMPAIKIPKVSDYFPEITLLEAQSIELFRYLVYIPEALLLLVRAVLSGAIILFCCKEVYDIFEYILTMRGGKSG